MRRFRGRRRRIVRAHQESPLVCGPCGSRFHTLIELQVHAQSCWRPARELQGDRPWDIVRPHLEDPRVTL